MSPSPTSQCASTRACVLLLLLFYFEIEGSYVTLPVLELAM